VDCIDQRVELPDCVVSVVTGSDNSFTSRWVKLGSRFCNIHAGIAAGSHDWALGED